MKIDQDQTEDIITKLLFGRDLHSCPYLFWLTSCSHSQSRAGYVKLPLYHAGLFSVIFSGKYESSTDIQLNCHIFLKTF